MRVSFLLLGFAACATWPVSGPLVPSDLSGEWNDVDANLVAETMIRDVLASHLADEWARGHSGTIPTLRLYPVRNRTTAYIDHRFFTDQIERALVTSGKFKVLSEPRGPRTIDGDGVLESDDDRAHGRDEREADFVLNGWVLSQDERDDRTEVRTYLASLEIVETATERKAWVGQKQLRKLIRKDSSPR